MSDEIIYDSQVSFLDALPIIGLAKIQISAVASAMMPEIAAKIAAATSLAANIGIKLPSIALATKILAAMTASIGPPGIDFTVTACTTLIARLNVFMGALQLALAWGSYPGTLRLIVYEGTASGFAPKLSAAINDGTMSPRTIILAPCLIVDEGDPTSLASMRILVKVS